LQCSMHYSRRGREKRGEEEIHRWISTAAHLDACTTPLWWGWWDTSNATSKGNVWILYGAACAI
jgi:hypothetical protein